MVSTHLKNISQIGTFPQVGMNIKNIWNPRSIPIIIHRPQNINMEIQNDTIDIADTWSWGFFFGRGKPLDSHELQWLNVLPLNPSKCLHAGLKKLLQNAAFVPKKRQGRGSCNLRNLKKKSRLLSWIQVDQWKLTTLTQGYNFLMSKVSL